LRIKMLSKKQIQEIREHLDKSQNPLFFFDNDTDGLCSFLLLQRFSGKGKGVAIKSFPELTEEYFRKVQELNADYIFILDKPLVSKEFFEKSREFNIPIVIIDHHDIEREKIPEFVSYYNPVFNLTEESGPTTYLCYQVSQKKEDLWIAVAGCISDRYVPDFYDKFKESYPDLSVETDDAFGIRYRSGIGKITNLFSFALKDRTTNVVKMTRFLMEAKNPYEVLEETSKNYTMHKRFKQIDFKYQRLIERAKKITNLKNFPNRLLFFRYSGDLSISSDLANELSYLFPEKIIIVAFVSGMKVNISARGRGIRKIILKIIKNLENSSGGGHEDAVGAQIRSNHLEEFKKRIMGVVEKQ